MDKPLVRRMALSDIPMVVTVHMQSFPHFFLTFLGPDFLNLLYRSIYNDPTGITLVATSGEDRIAGFVAGVTQQSGFYQHLIKTQIWTFARAALGASLKCPKIVPRLLRALRRPTDTQESAAEACLMAIAVHPDFQGEGIGKQLVASFCCELIARGIPAVCLTTDQYHNEVANHFYQIAGFRLARSYVTPEGRAMNEYVKDLRKEPVQCDKISCPSRHP